MFLMLSWFGCKDEPPPLAALVDGDFYGYVDVGEGQWPALASLSYDEEERAIVEAIVEIEEGDGTERSYQMIDFNEVEIGLSFAFIETAGVREMYLDALEPLEPFWWGSYRTRWFCAEEEDGYCNVDGLFRFDPVQ